MVQLTLVEVLRYPVAVGNVIITTAPLGNTVAVWNVKVYIGIPPVNEDPVLVKAMLVRAPGVKLLVK